MGRRVATDSFVLTTYLLNYLTTKKNEQSRNRAREYGRTDDGGTGDAGLRAGRRLHQTAYRPGRQGPVAHPRRAGEQQGGAAAIPHLQPQDHPAAGHHQPPGIPHVPQRAVHDALQGGARLLPHGTAVDRPLAAERLLLPHQRGLGAWRAAHRQDGGVPHGARTHDSAAGGRPALRGQDDAHRRRHRAGASAAYRQDPLRPGAPEAALCGDELPGRHRAQDQRQAGPEHRLHLHLGLPHLRGRIPAALRRPRASRQAVDVHRHPEALRHLPRALPMDRPAAHLDGERLQPHRV